MREWFIDVPSSGADEVQKQVYIFIPKSTSGMNLIVRDGGWYKGNRRNKKDTVNNDRPDNTQHEWTVEGDFTFDSHHPPHKTSDDVGPRLCIWPCIVDEFIINLLWQLQPIYVNENTPITVLYIKETSGGRNPFVISSEFKESSLVFVFLFFTIVTPVNLHFKLCSLLSKDNTWMNIRPVSCSVRMLLGHGHFSHTPRVKCQLLSPILFTFRKIQVCGSFKVDWGS